MIDAYEVYMIHHALKMHFTTDYDFIRYNGKMRFMPHATFLTKNYKMFYYRIGQKYGTSRTTDFFIANMVNDPNKFIGDYWVLGHEVYDDWVRRTEALTRNFEMDMKNVFSWCVENGYDARRITVPYDNGYPPIFKMLIKDLIMPETYVIMDNLFCVSTQVDFDDPIWNQWTHRMKKYSPFLSFDKEAVRLALKRCINNYTSDI